MVYHFCSGGGGGTGRYPEHGTCFDKYIHPLLAIYSSPFGKFGCEPFGRAAPYKKRGVNIPIFHVLEGPPQDPTKKVFDLIIGIFSHPPRARSIDPGHFVGNCFWLGTDFCRTS